MDIGTGTLLGQIFGLLFLVVIIYLFALVPISLKRIAGQLAEIKNELRERNKNSQASHERQ